MAKSIMNGKLYDTDNSELFIKIRGEFFIPVRIYKTKTGNWFSVYNFGFAREAYMEDESSVKTLVGKLKDVELYGRFFGKLKEA